MTPRIRVVVLVTLVLLAAAFLAYLFEWSTDRYVYTSVVLWLGGLALVYSVRSGIRDFKDQQDHQRKLRRFVAWQQLQSKQCPVCGYSTIGNVSGTCPECGTTWAEWFKK